MDCIIHRDCQSHAAQCAVTYLDHILAPYGREDGIILHARVARGSDQGMTAANLGDISGLSAWDRGAAVRTLRSISPSIALSHADPSTMRVIERADHVEVQIPIASRGVTVIARNIAAQRHVDALAHLDHKSAHIQGMTDNTRKRQPKGTTTGGQFATEAKGEAGVALTQPAEHPALTKATAIMQDPNIDSEDRIDATRSLVLEATREQQKRGLDTNSLYEDGEVDPSDVLDDHVGLFSDTPDREIKHVVDVLDSRLEYLENELSDYMDQD